MGLRPWDTLGFVKRNWRTYVELLCVHQACVAAHTSVKSCLPFGGSIGGQFCAEV